MWQTGRIKVSRLPVDQSYSAPRGLACNGAASSRRMVVPSGGINRIGNIGLQGFGKRAAIHFCALMGQVGLYVDVYFAADLTPEVAEGVVSDR